MVVGLGGCPDGFDSFLQLRDPTETQVQSDDDLGVDLCSKITRAVS